MFEINFVNHEILLKIKTGYIQTDEGGGQHAIQKQ